MCTFLRKTWNSGKLSWKGFLLQNQHANSQPPESRYAGAVFLMYLDMASPYPNQSPKTRFLTPILHPNITKQGRICHSILDRKIQMWYPMLIDRKLDDRYFVRWRAQLDLGLASCPRLGRPCVFPLLFPLTLVICLLHRSSTRSLRHLILSLKRIWLNMLQSRGSSGLMN
jgi:hypothetical protein